MLVYLFELDSVRNSAEEIKIGQQALFEEIVINGNQVAISFNQLTDSESFLKMIEDENTYQDIISLFRCGALKVSRYGKFRTASQYIQNAIEKCVKENNDAFLFSGLPVKCTDKELLIEIKETLVYADLTRLEDMRDQCEAGSEEWKRIDYIWKYIRMILILSMEKLAMNPAKETVRYSYMDYMERIRVICGETGLDIMNRALDILSVCEEQLRAEDETLLYNRTNWVTLMDKMDADESVFLSEALVDLCYNYTIEESIRDVSRHFKDEAGFRIDFFERLKKYWEEYEKKIHFFHKGDGEKIPSIGKTHSFWDTAVRLIDDTGFVRGNEAEEQVGCTYEEEYEKRKFVWKKERVRKLIKWFATAVVYIFIFYAVEKGLDYLEGYVIETTVNFRLNVILSGLLDTICFGVLGSWISDKLQLVDVLQSFRNIATGIQDIARIRKSPKQMSYRRKDSSNDNMI